MKCQRRILKSLIEILIIVTLTELMGYFLFDEKTSVNDILKWFVVLVVIWSVLEGIFRLIIKK
jgi:hypothetical protein